MTELGIIIINYNSPDDTLECLKSVEKYASSLKPIVLLYDNSDSFPLTPKQLSKFKLQIQFFECEKNLGFAGAVNRGLKYLQKVNCKSFFLLNNDVVLVDDSLQKMLDGLQDNEEVQIVGGINYYFQQSNKVWQAGFKNNWITGRVKHIIPLQGLEQVDYVPGSTLLARLSLVSKMGYFDEQFFHYFEEHDFCLRASEFGKVVVLGDTRFLHKVDNRDRKDSPFIFYYMTRNQLIFIAKHLSGFRAFNSLLVVSAYNLLRAFKFDLQVGRHPAFIFLRTYLTATYHFIKGRTGQYLKIQP